MPNKNGKSLANRLAAVANRQHEERMWKKNPLSRGPTGMRFKTQKNYNAWKNSNEGKAFFAPKNNTGPVHQNMTNKKNNTKKNKVNCGAKPTKVWKNSKTKTNEFLKWNACTKAAAAAGGARRKTRKGKKSRRMTRRR